MSRPRSLTFLVVISAVLAAPAVAAPAGIRCANPVTHDWASQISANDSSSSQPSSSQPSSSQPSSGGFDPFVLAGIEVTPTSSATAGSRVSISQETLSGDAGHVALFHPGDNPGRRTIFELTFSHPVLGVEVELLDVDSAEDAFRDVIEVHATNGDQDVTESITAQVGVGTRAAASADGTFAGVSTSDNDLDLANVSLAVAGPITALQIAHIDGGGPDGRITGVGDLTICGPQVGAALDVIALPGGEEGVDRLDLELVVENLGGVPLESIVASGRFDDVGTPTDGPPADDEYSLSAESPAVRADLDASGAYELRFADSQPLEPGGKRVVTMSLDVPKGWTPLGIHPGMQLQVSAVSSYDGSVTTDLTDGGLEPDVNANGDPSEPFEDDPTPLPVPDERSQPSVVPVATLAAVLTVAAIWKVRTR